MGTFSFYEKHKNKNINNWSIVVSTLTMKPDEFLGIVFYTNADVLLGLGEGVSSPIPSTI
jgi:hypothetical protein